MIILFPVFLSNNNEELVRGPAVAKAIVQNYYEEANLTKYSDVDFAEMGIGGGNIRLKFDNGLLTAVEYYAEKELNPKQLKLLTDFTSGQLSDGFGESTRDVMIQNQKYNLSLYGGDRAAYFYKKANLLKSYEINQYLKLFLITTSKK